MSKNTTLSTVKNDRVSLHIPSLPLADAYKFLGEELGFDVYYENGIIFLKEKKKVSR